MRNIAMENQLSETAFLSKKNPAIACTGSPPVTEVDLCGHVTLASAHMLFAELGHVGESVVFQSRSGPLKVRRSTIGYEMGFPSDHPEANRDNKSTLADALGVEVKEVLRV
jgi:predicted PhzF superfamily epimerase YddE/YHI9